jgi:hypothetical protein
MELIDVLNSVGVTSLMFQKFNFQSAVQVNNVLSIPLL